MALDSEVSAVLPGKTRQDRSSLLDGRNLSSI